MGSRIGNGCETHCLGRWPDGVFAMGVKPIVWAVGPMVLLSLCA